MRRATSCALVALLALVSGCDSAAGSFEPSQDLGRLAIDNHSDVDWINSVVVKPCTAGVGSPGGTNYVDVGPGKRWSIDLIPACYRVETRFKTSTRVLTAEANVKANELTLKSVY